VKRRTYLASIGAGASLSGGFVLANNETGTETSEQENTRIVYEHDDLRLQTLQDSVRLGETIKFKVTNTSDSTVTLGCDNAWIIQEYSDDDWHDVTRRPQSYNQLCAFELHSGESRVERATMSKDELEEQTGKLLEELHPGRYRFVLLTANPRLAVDFRITSPK
jgi:hypothetical protein